MKHIVIYSLSIAFAAIGMASCAKSTKGKMANEWRMTSYEQNRILSTGLNVNQEKMTMDETTYSAEHVQIQNGVTTPTYSGSGTVNNYVLTIKKDGTWSWITDVTRNGQNGQARVILDQTGTWSFIGRSKTSDFKKNERVLFNILTEKETMKMPSGEENSWNHAYLTGENTLIYTIVESKRKELVLEFDNTITVKNNNGDPSSDQTIRKITFKEK